MKRTKCTLALLTLAAMGLTACQTGSDNSGEMDRYVGELMSRMTLEEKVGQLNLKSNWMYFTNSTINEEDTSIKQIKQGLMGGVYGFTNPEMIATLQHYAVDSTRLGIPLLFGNDVYSSSTRPVKELRKFKQIELRPSQTETVSFELTQDDLGYYDHELNYVCEPGEFEIMIGPNSRDVKRATLVAE